MSPPHQGASAAAAVDGGGLRRGAASVVAALVGGVWLSQTHWGTMDLNGGAPRAEMGSACPVLGFGDRQPVFPHGAGGGRDLCVLWGDGGG